MKLSFLNANWLRRYPLQTSVDTELPNALIVGARLMVSANYLQVAISKVVIANGYINIEFMANGVVLGSVTGKPTQSNQCFTVVPLIPTFSGFIVIGNIDLLQNNIVYTLVNGYLEPSTVTVFTPPIVTGIKHNRQTLTGTIGIKPTSLLMSTTANDISLAVLAPNDVASRSAADQTSALLTCTKPVISGINTVTPDQNNNIDIYGVEPVTVATAAGSVTVSTTKAVVDVCKTINIPPTDEVNTYLQDVTTATAPEWKSWPQFN